MVQNKKGKWCCREGDDVDDVEEGQVREAKAAAEENEKGNNLVHRKGGNYEEKTMKKLWRQR